MNHYWAIGVRVEKDERSATQRRLTDAVSQVADTYTFNIPNDLKVGTIDKLITLSDDLAKLDPFLAGLARKIKRTYDDAMINEPPSDYLEYQQHKQPLATSKDKKEKKSSKHDPPKKSLLISPNTFDHDESSRLTPREYLSRFRWNDNAYGETTNVEKLKNKILEGFSTTDDELKTHTSKYSETRNALQAQERKENGNLLVRPISKFIHPEDIVETAHLTTVILAIPRNKEQEFLSLYMDVERRYYEKVAAEEERRRLQEEKERKLIEEKEAKLTLINKSPPATKSNDNANEDEEEEPEPEPEPTSGQDNDESTPSEPQVDPTKIDPNHQLLLEYGRSTDYKPPTVVPHSAKKLVGEQQAPEDEFSLYRVVLFKHMTPDEKETADKLAKAQRAKGITPISGSLAEKSTANVERFKTLCRDYRWTVRPYIYDPREEEILHQEMKTHFNQRRREWEMLTSWCEQLFEEVFIAWIHVVAMRTFVEVRLRYGIHTDYLTMLVQPRKNQERKTRDILSKLYIDGGNDSMFGASDDGTGEYYPYVSTTVDMADM